MMLLVVVVTMIVLLTAGFTECLLPAGSVLNKLHALSCIVLIKALARIQSSKSTGSKIHALSQCIHCPFAGTMAWLQMRALGHL